jgi:hypothetical protein
MRSGSAMNALIVHRNALAAAGLFALASVQAAPPSGPEARFRKKPYGSSLQAELRVAKAKVVVKEPVLVEYGVKNTSSAPVNVTSLFSVSRSSGRVPPFLTSTGLIT